MLISRPAPLAETVIVARLAARRWPEELFAEVKASGESRLPDLADASIRNSATGGEPLKGVGETFITVLASLWIVQISNAVFAISLPVSIPLFPVIDSTHFKVFHIVVACLYLILLWRLFIRIPHDIGRVSQSLHQTQALFGAVDPQLPARLASNYMWQSFWYQVCFLVTFFPIYSRIIAQSRTEVSVFHGFLIAALILIASLHQWREGV
jgi:hypothetical protein